MVAKRGIMFEFQTSVSPAAAKAFEALEKRAEELQKRMNLTLNVVERGARARGAANGSNGNGANGSSAVSNADIKAAERAAQARERAAERAFRTEARWNRQAEAAIARREAAEEKAARSAERDAKRSADAKIREAKRAEQATQKEFSAAARRQKAEALREQKADREFWKGVERFGEDRAKLKIDAEKQAAAEQKKAAREKQQADREAELSARKAAEAQNKIREGVYGTVHAFGQLTRAAAQFGLVGQRDMSRVLDTIFAVEGSINALQGVMGAARAIGGMRGAGGGDFGPAAALSAGPMSRTLGHLLKRAGLSSFGVAGGLGLTAAGAATAGLGIAGGLGTLADYNRGVGPGHVGGFWDTVGIKGLGAASSVAGLGVRALSVTESAFNSPYGLTSRERELRSEKITQGTFRDEQVRNLPLIKTLAATGVLDKILSDQETERRERFRAEDERKLAEKREREELRERISAPGNAAIYRAEREQRYQAYQLRSAGRYARAELFGDFRNRAFGRQQEAHEEQLQLQERRALGQYVSPAQARRAADEERREQEVVERFSGRRIQELRNQRAANDTRGGALQTEYNTAKAEYDRLKAKQQTAPGSDVFGLQDVESAAPAKIAAAYDKMKAVESQLLDNTKERAQLTAQITESEIDGAQKALQLHERDYAAAKRRVVDLDEQRQSAKERFGQLLPEQQRSLIEAAEAMRAGHANRLQAERLRQFGDLFEPELRARDERLAERGGFDRLLGASSLPGRLGNAEAQEIKLHVTFDEREAVRVKLEEESTRRARETADAVIQLLRQVFEHERTETERLIKEKLDENTRNQGAQGRALFGVG